MHNGAKPAERERWQPGCQHCRILMVVVDPQGSYAVLDTFTPSPLPGWFGPLGFARALSLSVLLGALPRRTDGQRDV